MIYVDDAAIKYRYGTWYHLMSDQPGNDEIHDFAAKLNLKREWFQDDHYDIVQSKRTRAIDLGACSITARRMVEIRKRRQSTG